MRLHAEWDTSRRRTAEQREAEKSRAAEKLVTDLASTAVDDFERTMGYRHERSRARRACSAAWKRCMPSCSARWRRTASRVPRAPKARRSSALEAQASGHGGASARRALCRRLPRCTRRATVWGAKVLRPAMVTVPTGGPRRRKARGCGVSVAGRERARTAAFGRSGGPGPARAALTAPRAHEGARLGKRGHAAGRPDPVTDRPGGGL